MNYITTVQAAKKWKITSRRVLCLAQSGRIKGAVQIGSRWMIPENATKPDDGRTKEVKTSKVDSSFFRYPAFEGKDIGSFNPPLSNIELQIKWMNESFHSCKFNNAETILNNLLKLKTKEYQHTYILYVGCCIFFYLNKTKEYNDCYNKLIEQLKKDFPRKKEMSSLLYELKIITNKDDNETFIIDPTYQYHESYLSHLANLCLLSLNKNNKKRLSVNDFNAYEFICLSLENSGSYSDLQLIHLCLAVEYNKIKQTDKMNYHYQKALQLSEKYNLYYYVALFYHNYQDSLNTILEQFSDDYISIIKTLSSNLNPTNCD